MNVGKAITAGMRADRRDDINRARWGYWGVEHMDRMGAWAMWGWTLRSDGRGSLGYPGIDFGGRS